MKKNCPLAAMELEYWKFKSILKNRFFKNAETIFYLITESLKVFLQTDFSKMHINYFLQIRATVIRISLTISCSIWWTFLFLFLTCLLILYEAQYIQISVHKEKLPTNFNGASFYTNHWKFLCNLLKFKTWLHDF